MATIGLPLMTFVNVVLLNLGFPQPSTNGSAMLYSGDRLGHAGITSGGVKKDNATEDGEWWGNDLG
jgi:hypothetical protein